MAVKTDSERNLAAAMKNGSAILTSTGVAVGSHLSASALSGRVQSAMLAALVSAQAEGVTDPTQLRKRMLIAKDQTLGGG